MEVTLRTTGKMNWAIRRPLALVLSLLLAGFVALSIHVGMLSLGVAYPQSAPPRWSRWINAFSSVSALLIVLTLARPKIGRYSLTIRWLIAFAVLVMIQETLRGGVMNGVVTGGWTFSLIVLIEPAARALLISLVCVVAARWVRSAVSLVMVGIVATALLIIAQLPIAEWFAPLTEHFAYLSRPDAYQFPYPAAVMIPAYLSFIEAVVGATLLTCLIWASIPGHPIVRAAALGLLVALIKGVVVATFLFAFFTDADPLTGMLHYSQFLLEFLALGVLVGLAWARFGDPRSGLSQVTGVQKRT